MSKLPILWVGLSAATLLCGAVVDTTDPGVVAAFQAGATVVDFEAVSGITPMAITAYTDGVPVTAGATVFDEIPGVQFSVGGNPGSFATEPVVFQLGGGIGGDAKSPTNVLGSADMAGNTKFNGFIEVYFPTKVDRVGFWLNPSLVGDVLIIAKDNQTAFSGDPNENQLETATVVAGHFVGFQRASADIGGLTILPLGAGTTIDDFTFGAGSGPTAVPEPGTLALAIMGAVGLLAARRRR